MTTVEDDAARLSLLEAYAVLDQPPRRELAALVELAAKFTGVPMATINLITDDQQFQVATYGFDGDVCSREDSMCNTVLEEGRPILLSDASLDPRFRDNPFTTGEIADVRFYASHPLRTPDGTTIGTLCVFDEVRHPVGQQIEEALDTLSARVVDVLELELTSRRLAEANERLAAFAGQVSHDLKNPLSAIRMSMELAREELGAGDGDDDVLRSLLERSERGADRMNVMIGDLLDFARGGTSPERDDVPLDDLLRDVVEDLGDAAAARVSGPGLPVVCADRSQLRVVVQNLVANALKFSPDGSPVEVAATRQGAVWRITVADHGPGVPPEERQRVFDPMVRLDKTIPGTGIGLATCRRIVEAHGGRIGIVDNGGGGSVVWLDLPDSDD